MNAILEISGKQYSVNEGDRVKVASQNIKVGDTITLNRVLYADDGNKTHVGSPVLKSATIQASVIKHGRDRKVLIYKKKRRKGYQRKNGHRQGYTLLQIDKIDLSAAKKKSAKKPIKKSAKEEK